MTDTRLRTALRELADVVPPPDLAGAALPRARRDRRRRVTGLVAGVAVLAAAAVTVPALTLGRAAPAEPAAAARTQVVLAGYAYRDPGAATLGLGRYRMLDRASGRYEPVPWRTGVPSPDGRLVAVTEDRNGRVWMGIVAADRIRDRTAVRWLPGDAPSANLARVFGPGVWSPDGSRLLLVANFRAAVVAGRVQTVETTVRVVDVRSLAAREVTLRTEQVDHSSGAVTFGPRGRGFAVAPLVEPAPGGGRATTGVLTLFDEQGGRTGRVRVGAMAVADHPFSPDGRRVTVSTPGPTGESTRVLDVATGAVVGRAEGAAVGWADDRHYVVVAGRAIRTVELASGRVGTERQPAPAGRELTGGWLARVTAPPPGAIVL